MTIAVVLQFCYCLVSIKHDGFGKRLSPSAKISYTVSCNISLYRDTKDLIYRYIQNVYCYIFSGKGAETKTKKQNGTNGRVYSGCDVHI